MFEQIVGLRIGIGELIPFRTAVCEKAEMHNLSRESAAYRVIEDIRDYNRLGGMKKQQSDIATQKYLLNQFSGRQNNAIMALFKLQIHGFTEAVIIDLLNLPILILYAKRKFIFHFTVLGDRNKSKLSTFLSNMKPYRYI